MRNYKGFHDVVSFYEESGIPLGTKKLIELAKEFDLPIPRHNNQVFDIINEVWSDTPEYKSKVVKNRLEQNIKK